MSACCRSMLCCTLLACACAAAVGGENPADGELPASDQRVEAAEARGQSLFYLWPDTGFSATPGPAAPCGAESTVGRGWDDWSRRDRAVPDPDFGAFAQASGLRFLGQGRPTRIYRSVFLGRLWVSGEYLAWALKGQRLPPLLSTGPATDPSSAGVVGRPGTEVLFGNNTGRDQLRSGGRISLGYWCTPFQETGIEGTFFGVDGADRVFRVESSDNPVLARPYVQLPDFSESALLVAYPGLWEGQSVARFDFQLSGAELLVRRVLGWAPRYRLDGLIGYRYGFLSDRLDIRDTSIALDPASGFAPETFVEREDLFRVSNHLHGCEFGVSGRWWHGCWSLQGLSKVTLGGTQAKTTIRGETVVTEINGGVPIVSEYEGGLLAQSTNSGSFSDTQFGALSEFGLALEYQIRDDVRAAVGYTFLYWNSVARAGGQIDRVINPTQIPPGDLLGMERPQFALQRTDFWAQGINLRLEYQY